MSGCQTCGGYGMRHDPVAHGTEPSDVHLMPAGEDDHHHGWDCYCVPPWTDADGVRTYLHRDASYWADR